MKNRVLFNLIARRYGLWIAGILLVLITIWIVRWRRPESMDWQFIQAFGIRLPMRYGIHGIDVSRHNDRIDWARVRKMEAYGVRLQFVFIKATEGATLSDKHFKKIGVKPKSRPSGGEPTIFTTLPAIRSNKPTILFGT